MPFEGGQLDRFSSQGKGPVLPVAFWETKLEGPLFAVAALRLWGR
jgi:hypothetical protein